MSMIHAMSVKRAHKVKKEKEEKNPDQAKLILIFKNLNHNMYKYIKHQPLRKPRSCNVDFDFFFGGGASLKRKSYEKK